MFFNRCENALYKAIKLRIGMRADKNTVQYMITKI